MQPSKRRYDSSRRREQMAAGHRRILDAARALFVRSGYAAVSIEQIAAGAAVAVPTVYTAFGSKRAVMAALLDDRSIEAETSAPADDPEEQLRAALEAAVRSFANHAGLLEACRASGDSQLVSLWREDAERRREAAAGLVSQWSEAGVLASRLSAAEALDVYEALAGPETFRRLVEGSGWTPERYVQWLYELLRWELFGRYRGLRRPT